MIGMRQGMVRDLTHDERQRFSDGRTTAMPRLNINLNDETADALRELADRRSITLIETVRRAVSTLVFVEREVIDADKELRLRSRDGSITRVEVL